MKKIKVYFEKIGIFHYPLVVYFLCRGREIFLFDFNYDVKKRLFLRWLVNTRRVRPIYVGTIAKGQGEAIDQTDFFYDRFRNNRCQSVIRSLYQSDEADLVFKRGLAWELFKSIHMNDYLASKEAEEGAFCCFVPLYYFQGMSLLSPFGKYEARKLCKTTVPFAARILSVLQRGSDRGFYLVGGFFFLFFKTALLFLTGVFYHPRLQRKHFKYAIPINQVFEIKFTNKRSFNFLLDESNIRREDVVFLMEMTSETSWLQHQKKEGFHFLEVSRLHRLSFLDSWSLLKTMIKTPFFREQFVFSLTALKMIHYYILYRLIDECVSFDHYVYANKDSQKQIALNALIKQGGAKVWHYSYSVGGSHLYTPKGGNLSEKRQILLSYLNSDHFLTINDTLIRHHKNHSQKVSHYHSIGNIYSEMIKNSEVEVKKKEIAENFFGKYWIPEGRLIAFYDTTFIDAKESPTNYEDALCFYQDILRLIEEDKNLFTVIKPSKDESFFVSPHSQWSSPSKGRVLLELWKILKHHPRSYWAGDCGDSPLIMAVSDVIITHVFSSPTAEALGARKKAFWYKSGGKRWAPIYDHIPGLVIHGYDDLKKRAHFLLYETTDAEYKRYLEEHVKGEVEPFLDGAALSRLRGALTEQSY